MKKIAIKEFEGKYNFEYVDRESDVLFALLFCMATKKCPVIQA